MSVCLSHIKTHMSTHTGCKCGCFAWCLNWSSQVSEYLLWSPATSLTQVHVWACGFLSALCSACWDLHAQPCIAAIHTYIDWVYKLIVSFRGLPLSSPELSWEVHVMSSTFSLTTKLPIMDRQGSVTRELTPANICEDPDPPSTSCLPLLNLHFGFCALFLDAILSFLLPVWYLSMLILNLPSVLPNRALGTQ